MFIFIYLILAEFLVQGFRLLYLRVLQIKVSNSFSFLVFKVYDLEILALVILAIEV